MRNALLRINGTIEVGKPPIRIFSAIDLQQEMAAFLRRRTESRVVRSSPSIWLERGYHLWPHSSDALGTFDPVEISVQVGSEQISLHYTLGLRPLYLGLATFLSSLCVLSIYYQTAVVIVLAVYSIIALFTTVGLLIRIRQFRHWLREIASSVVEFAED